MKYLVVFFVFVMVACSATQSPLTVSTETQLLPTSTVTPQPPIVVTHIIRIEPTVVVTATPEPLLAQECFNDALKQGELNSCANMESSLAKAELERIISLIKFSSDDEKQTFEELQASWELQVQLDCEFFYGQVVEDNNGNLYYAGGSMAPMRRAFCQADQYKNRIKELKYAYLGFGN